MVDLIAALDPVALDSAATDVTALGTVLTVWAHPDDESYLAGGLVGALRDAGSRVVCVTATRGEAADPLASEQQRSSLAAVRTHELAEALSLLGVTEHHWLDCPDGGCAEVDIEGPVGRLVRLLDDVRPETIVTFGPDGFTGHPDHQAVSRWVDLALGRSGARPRVLHAVAPEEPVDPDLDQEFGVYDLGRPRTCRDEEVTVRLRLGGAALDRKVAALMAQASQTGGVVAAAGLERYREWVAMESFALPR